MFCLKNYVNISLVNIYFQIYRSWKMSNSPSWPAHLSPQSQKPSTSWTLPALKITNFWENTKRRNLTKWSSKSRMLGLLWRSVNGVSLRMISPKKDCHTASVEMDGAFHQITCGSLSKKVLQRLIWVCMKLEVFFANFEHSIHFFRSP